MAFFGLFGGGKPNPIGNNPDALESNFDKRMTGGNGMADSGFLNIDPKLAMLSQIFANMAGRDSPVFQYSMLQAQQRRAQQQADLKRQQDWEDFQREEQWKRDNPMPHDDAFIRALAAAGIMPGTPEYAAMARKRAEMLTNPVQLVPDGMGGVQPVRPYGGGAAPMDLGTELPQGWTIEGDGGGNATGGFP